ncbi:MAG: SAM-dependent methyltransferase [Opitutae bacterium]|nr:SAM-dependent methyltransferase [Opitutae bacterium]
MTGRCEYGDWQTNIDLARAVCKFLKSEGVSPQIIIEPTCGKGNFILAALEVFADVEEIWGIEINRGYLKELNCILNQSVNCCKTKIKLINENVFHFNFAKLKNAIHGKRVLVLGNPPWVTNSKQGAIGGTNLPPKSNFKGEKGVSAITGKGNFDIAEYIVVQLAEFLKGEDAVLSLLVKNTVVKNLVYCQRNWQYGISRICQYDIDSKKEFDVSVSMSMLKLDFGGGHTTKCEEFDFYSLRKIKEYGWVGDNFVSNTKAYESVATIDGVSQFKWRSGVKHDCAKIMELTFDGESYENGLGEKVEIEESMIYPLIKSSDVGEIEINTCRRYVIITQQNTSEDTDALRIVAPKAYKYLTDHAEYFDRRGSSIYEKRSRFCLFGIGEYSFCRYKVVISGLYKHAKFSLVGPIEGKPAMLDDTCYMLGFDNRGDAEAVLQVLNCRIVQAFIRSISFCDAKRVICKDLLMRIDFEKITERFNCTDLGVAESDYERLCELVGSTKHCCQMSLF